MRTTLFSPPSISLSRKMWKTDKGGEWNGKTFSLLLLLCCSLPSLASRINGTAFLCVQILIRRYENCILIGEICESTITRHTTEGEREKGKQIRNKNAKNDDYTISVEMISSSLLHKFISFIFMCLHIIQSETSREKERRKL